MLTQRIATLTFLLAPAALAAQGAATTPAASSQRPLNAGAHVTMDLGNGSQADFDTRSFELGISRATSKDDAPAASLPAVHLVKRAGPFTGTLVQTSASGQHLPTVWLTVPDTTGAPAMTITLSDVVIDTDRLVLSSARAALEQQRIAQEAGLTQLNTDYQEAQRQLAIAEQLGKSRVTTPQDLSRAREHASDVQRRLQLARQSQAMLETQLAEQGPMDEELTLRFERITIDGADPGAHGAWDFSAVAPVQGTKKPRQ